LSVAALPMTTKPRRALVMATLRRRSSFKNPSCPSSLLQWQGWGTGRSWNRKVYSRSRAALQLGHTSAGVPANSGEDDSVGLPPLIAIHCGHCDRAVLA
jgi:hypothetical protein